MIDFISGLALGIFFYGGLWLTIQKALTSKRPALWFVGSYIFRMVTTVAVFYWVSGGSWRALLICLGGFLAGRLLVTYWTRGAVNRANIRLK